MQFSVSGATLTTVKTDFLIIGQGLAGSLMAWQLLRRNQRVLVVDRDEEETSSKVAAGLVTPISGSRFKMSSDLERVLPCAQKFYWDLEEEMSARFFTHLRIARLFQDQPETVAWQKSKEKSPDHFAKHHSPLDIDLDCFRACLGGIEIKGGGWLNLPVFLEQTRQHLLERASYAIGKVDSAEIVVSGNGVHWKNVAALKGVIFCQGWRGDQNRFFDWIPMNPARGEILDITCQAAAPEQRIVNKGGWLLPRGEGKFRAGSNYDHQFESAAPTEAGLNLIIDKVKNILRPAFTVIRHRAAIRPIIRRSRIVMGTHPAHQQVAFFNGLGSKGVLNGPYYSDLLCSHLLNGAEIPLDMDIRKNF